jgi:hypothetical protein
MLSSLQTDHTFHQNQKRLEQQSQELFSKFEFYFYCQLNLNVTIIS